MGKEVTLTIDGRVVTASSDDTIWEAAKKAGITIPTLCHHPMLRPEGACRVCLCEVKGGGARPGCSAACITKVGEGMEVKTHSPLVLSHRKTIVELLLANHPRECLTCSRSGDCELQSLANDLGIREIPYAYNRPRMPIDDSNPSLVRDPNKCILCGRCVRMCSEIQTVSCYSFVNRGLAATVSPAFFDGLVNVACTFCGQCRKVCPVGAITIKSDIDKVRDAIADPEKIVMVQTAPSVRVGLSEAVGGQAGDIVTGKMFAALRQLGFDKVFDTNWSADLTIMEEGTELIGRVTNGGVLPMITSCSPGWINFIELKYPELLPHLSTAKSPQAMFGAMLKTYYAEANGIDPSKIVSVSIMPCTAKKYECQRPELCDSGYRDVDYVLTTVELGQMIKQANINFQALEEEAADPLMGVGTGAATIFGASGGVMEAAVRTAYFVLSGKELDPIDLVAVRGMEGIKEASLTIPLKDGGELPVKVAVANTLGNARKILESIKAGNPNGWTFVEVMACPGGCVNGGGQPIKFDITTAPTRQQALYQDDRQLPLRRSHENPEVMALYQGEGSFLGAPNSEKAHHLLHTHYAGQDRSKNLFGIQPK